jgi:CDP-glucose 4,6-dehydratase
MGLTYISPRTLAEVEDAFRGRQVLVTGHTGFTGGWLCLWLKCLGANVTGLSLSPNTQPNLYTDANIENGIFSIIGDVRDYDVVSEALRIARPEVVFHLAAQPLVSEAFERPLETFATNIMGTAHVMEAARNSPDVKAVVCVTTDKVYKDKAWPWGYREVDTLGGKDPYSASKACTELIASTYYETLSLRGNKVRIATARGGNIIGGGDWSNNRIVPDFMRAMIGKSTLKIRNFEAVRPWQHVLALVHGYLMLADKLLISDADLSWNFGPRSDEAKSVSELLIGLQSAWKELQIEYVPGGFPETHFLHLDSTKAKRELGWLPGLDFAETVLFTVEWYRHYTEYGPNSALAITLEQIENYRQIVRRGPR